MKIVAAILFIFVLLTVMLTGCGASEDKQIETDDDGLAAQDPLDTSGEFIDDSEDVEIGEMV